MRLAIFTLFFVGSNAFAGLLPEDFTLSWTNPSAYTDGTPIDAGDLSSIRVSCTRNGQPFLSDVVPANGVGLAQSNTWPALITNPGTYECNVFAVVIDGTESDPSNTTSKKYIGKPNPPTDAQN